MLIYLPAEELDCLLIKVTVISFDLYTATFQSNYMGIYQMLKGNTTQFLCLTVAH